MRSVSFRILKIDSEVRSSDLDGLARSSRVRIVAFFAIWGKVVGTNVVQTRGGCFQLPVN